jgi:hypothetical protein
MKPASPHLTFAIICDKSPVDRCNGAQFPGVSTCMNWPILARHGMGHRPPDRFESLRLLLQLTATPRPGIERSSRLIAALIAGIAGACAGPVIDRRIAGRLRINPVANPVVALPGRDR